jgi:hypothetical protein
MPPETISNTWAERTLTRPEWNLLLELIQKIQPDVYIASMKLDAWLGTEGIEGGSIKGKRRSASKQTLAQLSTRCRRCG